jgi:predicted porin
MNFKKTALVLAMAGVVAAPMAAQASASDGAYASIRIGLQNMDTANNSELTVRGYGARFGFKSEADLGNGMTGFGQYEFGVNTEGTNAATVTRRKASVGIKGDFGKVYIGQTSHTWYSMIVAPTDNPWWGSGYKVLQYGSRTDNGLTYAGDFGAVKVGVTAYLAPNNNGGGSDAAGSPDNVDGTEIAVSFDAGFAGIAIGVASGKGQAGAADPEDIVGISVNSIGIGSATLGFNYQQQDVANSNLTNTSLTADLTIASFYGHYESVQNDAAAASDPTSLTLGYSKSLGPQTTVWFEYQTIDNDVAGNSAADVDVIRATLKYDI